VRQGLFWNCAFYAFLVCTVAIVLAPPLFPSQDGPAIIMIRPTHPNRWTNLAAWDASASLSEAARSGEAVSELSFLVRQGPSRGATDAALSALRWSPAAKNSGLFGIYYRRP